MLELLGHAVTLAGFGLVYTLAWVAAWLSGRLLPVPDWLRPALPWGLLQAYIVGGLFALGDLPGAPRAVLRFLLLAAAAGLALGLLAERRRAARTGGAELPADGAAGRQCWGWVLAGVLPWLVALLAEAF